MPWGQLDGTGVLPVCAAAQAPAPGLSLPGPEEPWPRPALDCGLHPSLVSRRPVIGQTKSERTGLWNQAGTPGLLTIQPKATLATCPHPRISAFHKVPGLPPPALSLGDIHAPSFHTSPSPDWATEAPAALWEVRNSPVTAALPPEP